MKVSKSFLENFLPKPSFITLPAEKLENQTFNFVEVIDHEGKATTLGEFNSETSFRNRFKYTDGDGRASFLPIGTLLRLQVVESEQLKQDGTLKAGEEKKLSTVAQDMMEKAEGGDVEFPKSFKIVEVKTLLCEDKETPRYAPHTYMAFTKAAAGVKRSKIFEKVYQNQKLMDSIRTGAETEADPRYNTREPLKELVILPV